MVLLTGLALALLGLSSIAMRGSAAADAREQARANARLALMLAIGELQKTAGTDKAITASADITTETPAKPGLTGVWKSWNFDATASGPPDYTAEHKNRFTGWLVSDSNPLSPAAPTYNETAYTGDSIELVGTGSLGSTATAAEKVRAGKVPLVKNNVKQGNYAWYVADESVKARIGSYRDPSLNTNLAKKRALLAGNRPDVSVVSATDGTLLDYLPKDDSAAAYKTAKETSGKLVDLSQTDLMAKTPQAGKFRNSITPYSLGLMTDARNGGLKKDLNAIFEASSLPTEYMGKTLYQSTKTLNSLEKSDPYWSALASYYGIAKKITTPDSLPTYKVQLPTAVVKNLTTSSPTLPDPTAPTDFNPSPVVAKVELLFSVVLRDAHGNWVATLAGVNPQMKYMIHLLYTPVITLHNPYNVALQFEKLQVCVRNAPVGFNLYMNGVSQDPSGSLVPLTDMFVNGAGEKSFYLAIPSSTLKPGQSATYSPYVNPAGAWDANFDWTNTGHTGTLQQPIDMIAGFSGKQFGFDIDWITPHSYAQNADKQGVAGATATDKFHISFGILQPSAAPKDRFQVLTIVPVGSNSQAALYNVLDFNYGDQNGLAGGFPTTGIMNFPQSGEMTAFNMYDSNSIPLKGQANSRAIALFTASARNSNGGVYDTNKRTPTSGSLNSLVDGRLAGKPFLFNNSAGTWELNNLKTSKPCTFTHEMNFTALGGSADDVFTADGSNRSRLLTGISTTKGIKSGAYFELPTGPLQAISDFRRSNALTTPFQPSFVQPVSNSWASPLLSTAGVKEVSLIAGDPLLLDHSYLANHALYDGFYFSSIAPDASTSTSIDKVFKDFMEGNRPLPNQGFQPWVPKGQTVASLGTKYFSGGKPTATAYKEIAASQMVKGAFNVNSTNIQAWKAMLSGLNRSEVTTLWAVSGATEARKTANTPILPMTLPVGGSTAKPGTPAQIDDVDTNTWNGFRELTSDQVETLAKAIVTQVRKRGPFLSLSEFVNRRLGGSTDNLCLAGALQGAIDDTHLNDSTFSAPRYVNIEGGDVSNTALYGNYKTPRAVVGNPAQGAPGFIGQGDLMHLLEPSITVRGDTFVIRTCGEATDDKGVVISRAYAEAVVQRTPEFVDPLDNATVNIYDAAVSASQANKTFGRRFEVVSFRWLSTSEL